MDTPHCWHMHSISSLIKSPPAKSNCDPSFNHRGKYPEK
jgi:hypothetical protein